eukprot:GFUD01008199.1.p2 GENE.GFUD01008199.1~~GFUD01008199.1.p2  ORF type:complete len:182 (-),score=46.44 GFUD01008199.1:2007-2552(-)
MLRFYLLVLVFLLMLCLGLSIRMARDACDQVFGDFGACTSLSYNAYKAAFEAGDDGRPDWMARKACNYMTAAVEECGNKLVGECNSEQEVTDMKDHQLKVILMQLQTSVQEWDSEKCPAVKAHIDRMKGEAVAEVTVAKQNTAESEAMPNETIEAPMAAVTSGVESFSISLGFVAALVMAL